MFYLEHSIFVEAVSSQFKAMSTSDMDEDEDDLPLQKRKITMRNKSKRSKSNAFLKALNDSESSESPMPVKKNSFTKPTNNSNKTQQELHTIHTNISRKSNDSIATSIDQSHTVDKILKSKPNVFRKKYKEKSDNAFENLLKSNEDLPNKAERTETISKSSFAELIERNHTSKESVSDISKEENKSKMSPSRTVPFKKSIIDPLHDNNLIYLNRTDSSFNLSSNSNENNDLEIQPNHTHELSHKNVSKNISISQKESSVVEKNANLTMYPNTSFKKTNESTTNNEETENPESINKRETSLANIRHLTKAKDTRLKKNQIIEKIKKLRQEEKQKFSVKGKINEAYIVNGQVYRRPKLPRPKYWATDRLYRFLWKNMEPESKLLTRVHSEKFVQELSDIVSIIVKSKKYEDYVTILNNLMKKMATLGIVRTRNDFYNFCYDFLPYDFRIKVVPMVLPGNVKNIPYDPETLNKPLFEE